MINFLIGTLVGGMVMTFAMACCKAGKDRK